MPASLQDLAPDSKIGLVSKAEHIQTLVSRPDPKIKFRRSHIFYETSQVRSNVITPQDLEHL